MICPSCGVVLISGTDVTPGEVPRLPQRGDLGICERCQTWFILLSPTEGLALTPDELLLMPAVRRMLDLEPFPWKRDPSKRRPL